MDGVRTVDTQVGSLSVAVMGDGAPVVLWHSLFVDDRSWDQLVSELGGGYRLIRITGPGHGDSRDPGRRYSLDDCANAAHTVLDRLNVQGPVDWVGNAWGGHVGVIFAARSPERCRSLVTIGTPLQPLSPFERARTVVLLMAHRILGMTRFVQDAVIGALLSPHTRQLNPAAVELVRDCLTSADPDQLRNAVVSSSLRRPDSRPLLASISAPTVMITGTDHAGWTQAQAEDAARSMRNGSTALIAHAAYLGPLEAPAETAAIITRFWASSQLAPTPKN